LSFITTQRIYMKLVTKQLNKTTHNYNVHSKLREGTYNIDQGGYVPQGIDTGQTSRAAGPMAEESINPSWERGQDAQR
jgi:hypothetical protein